MFVLVTLMVLNLLILNIMRERILCLFRLHKYEVYKETDIKNIRGEVEAIAITSRCKVCGKMKTHIVPTLKTY